MFTPEGKVLPIESIFRSTEHGGVCAALRNRTTGIIIAQKTGKNDSFTDGKNKIKQLDKHLVYTYSGITNDGEKFGEYLKTALLAEKYATGAVLPISKLLEDTQFNCGLQVMSYGKRAMGVSVILLAIENGEVKLFEMLPTGETLSCFGSCIGFRAQSARTVIESGADNLLDLSDTELFNLCFKAFQNAVNDAQVISEKKYDVCTVSLERGITFTKGEEYLRDAGE